MAVFFTPAIVYELSLTLGTGSYGLRPIAIAAFYPLSLVILAFSPFAFRPHSYESPEAGVDFFKGVRYAMWTSMVISFPVALLLGLLYNQFLIGLSLFLIAFGSTLFPDISAAGVCGFLLLKGEGVDQFFLKAGKWILNRETRLIFWLAVLLRRRDLLGRLSLVGNYSSVYLGVYFLGWGLFSIGGGFPATIFGAMLGLLIPISSYFAIRKRLNVEDREKLANLLVSRTPKSFSPKTQPIASQ